MKKLILLCVLFAFGFGANAQLGKINPKQIKAATTAVQAFTLTDAQIAAYCQEYIDWMDTHNPVCDDSDPGMKVYADRLANLVKGHETENGIKLDIKAYYVVEQNAFSCANGSIRVLAGLMDVLNDDELFGVIGHEIGHLINKDSKDAFRTALLTSALKDAVASTSGTAAALSDSQLGDLAEALANAQYSQKQEYAADDYGFEFLKKNSKETPAMAAALRVIQRLQDEANVDKSKTKQLMSSHPDTAKRAERLDKKK
jgi:putative metalloprotease